MSNAPFVLARSFLLFISALVAAEVAARADDWLFERIPFFSTPSYESLFSQRPDGIRVGLPGSRWKAVQLNSDGLRGPELIHRAAGSCELWLFLGASETFGEPSVPDGDFPTYIRNAVANDGCIEVGNGSFPGLSLPEISKWYDIVLSNLGATYVFILPSSHMYLAEPATPSGGNRADATAPRGALSHLLSQAKVVIDDSRFIGRLKDSAEVPPFIQRWRTQRKVEKALLEHPPDWVLSDVPPDRLASFKRDLVALISVIRRHGAQPILISHPVSTSLPPGDMDMPNLFAMRVYTPRITEPAIAAFEYRAADVTRAVATELQVPLVDAAAAMSGNRDYFIDLVHYSPDGARELSVLIVDSMQPVLEEHRVAVQ